MIAQTLAINHRDRVRSLTCISSTPSPDIGRMRPLTMLRLLLANPVALTGRAPRDATEAGEWMQAVQPGRNFIGLLAVTPGALLGLILCAYNSRRRVRVTVAIPGGSQPVAMRERKTMSFLKLVFSFAPWIAFLVIARDTLRQVEIGLVVALALSVVMALLRLHRGIIMYVGLVFFTAATIAVLGFHNIWTVKHLGVMANGALAAGSWITLLIGKPFTLEYARQHTDPAHWNDPLFISANARITAVWATAFTFNTAVAWILMERLLPQWVCHTLTYTALVAAAAFSSWYPGYVRRTV